ncbi:hypothetical protein CDL62_17000 [Alkalitalea saponilacus]|uniref:Lipoprotein n=1 Tax=Alkalitalea saponilacus TaxID=889453 RepID=A0A1T5DL15_9BACT|nr:hypothetical protein [Alkalitalea saponilacus]ASB50725.1 hypothetical protein CDL62_17000 [Alkalitalea saponilacus]SKB72414.1 hypothetical protein SAMN03080601_01140 [Alkalitalea saponilacus]
MKTGESKLKRHLAYGGFSALLLFLVVASCCYNVEADYSFENKLNDEVRLTLYSSGSNIKGTKDYNIVEGGNIILKLVIGMVLVMSLAMRLIQQKLY